MLRYEFFKLDLAGLLIRFYLLMAVVIISGFSGQWWVALLALPIFLSAITGLKISFKSSTSEIEKGTGKIISLPIDEQREVG